MNFPASSAGPIRATERRRYKTGRSGVYWASYRSDIFHQRRRMVYTRRDFGKIAMAMVPAAAGLSIPEMAQAAQNSKIDGVQIGAITYSFRQGVVKTEL